MKRVRIKAPKIVRNHYQLKKKGESVKLEEVVDARVKGNYLVDIQVDHMADESASDVMIKGVVGAGADLKVRVSGEIMRGYQGVSSKMNVRIILLDDKSKVEVKPIFEVSSDEVKAVHAVSIANLDEDQVNYMRSRGIEEKIARNILIEGFLSNNNNKDEVIS